MSRNPSGRSPRRSRRCAHCGKDLPLRRGRPAARCPTCGAVQDYDDEDPLVRRQRDSGEEFNLGHLLGVILGGIAGLVLGIFFAVLLYRDKAPGTIVLLALVYGLGFAVLGCLFGFVTVTKWLGR